MYFRPSLVTTNFFALNMLSPPAGTATSACVSLWRGKCEMNTVDGHVYYTLCPWYRYGNLLFEAFQIFPGSSRIEAGFSHKCWLLFVAVFTEVYYDLMAFHNLLRVLLVSVHLNKDSLWVLSLKSVSISFLKWPWSVVFAMMMMMISVFRWVFLK